MASRTPRQFSAQAQYSGRVLASGAVPTAYQTLQEGLRGLPPFGLSRVLTEWTLDPFLLVGTVWVTGLYLWGVWTLRERGDRWPVGRSAAFLGGVACFTVATQSGLAAYDTALLSVHMVQHMVLAMVVPVFLALGAPVTLALRTLPPRPRGWLLVGLHSRVAKVLSFPVLTFALYVLFECSPFLIQLNKQRIAGQSHRSVARINHRHVHPQNRRQKYLRHRL